jgi:hemin uptake protein HemP
LPVANLLILSLNNHRGATGSPVMADNDPRLDEPECNEEPGEVPVVQVADWFGEHREICLELDGVRYRIRITRRKKLILQK